MVLFVIFQRGIGISVFVVAPLSDDSCRRRTDEWTWSRTAGCRSFPECCPACSSCTRSSLNRDRCLRVQLRATRFGRVRGPFRSGLLVHQPKNEDDSCCDKKSRWRSSDSASCLVYIRKRTWYRCGSPECDSVESGAANGYAVIPSRTRRYPNFDSPKKPRIGVFWKLGRLDLSGSLRKMYFAGTLKGSPSLTAHPLWHSISSSRFFHDCFFPVVLDLACSLLTAFNCKAAFFAYVAGFFRARQSLKSYAKLRWI